MSIDNKQVDLAIKAKIKVVVWDTELKGFGVRIYPSGSASWVIVKRLGAGGKKAKLIWQVLAPYKQLPYKDAFKKARSSLNDIAEGSDPVEKKRKARIKGIEVYQSGKLQDVFTRWYDKHSEPNSRYWNELKQRFDSQIIPTIGANTLVANVSKSELRKLIDDKEKITPAGARLTYAALSPFFKWCVSEEFIPLNPLEGVQSPESGEARDRVLGDDELVRIWEAASHTSYPWGPYYKLLMLSLQRRNEVAGMQWFETHEGRNEWIIPKDRTKNNQEHLVHLSPLAASILDDVAGKVPKILEGRFASPYVFLSSTNTTYISAFSQAKQELDDTIFEIYGERLQPWRIHDLRRTGATGMAMLKVQPHIVERVLNHISGSASAKLGGIDAALVRIYQRFEYADERREAINKWSDHVSSIVSKAKAAEANANNVIVLRA